MLNQITVESCLTFSSQPVMIASSRALLSRDKRLPLDTWNQPGLQENVFGNQFSTFDSPRDYSQRIESDDVQRNREAAPEAERTKTCHTSEDTQKQGTIPVPTFATKPLAASSTIPVELPQNYMLRQQRQQISELQLDKFLYPQLFFFFGKFDSKHKSCSDLPEDAMLWIKEVEMVDPRDQSVYGKDFPNIEMLDAKIASAHGSRRRSASRSRKPKKRTGFYEEDRSLS